jgi:TDG/mug DNA glycosylase family protein
LRTRTRSWRPVSKRDAGYAGPTLADLLAPALDVVFVGINPSIYSAERGHYFARPGNRFWPCVSRSILTQPIRAARAAEPLGPADDALLLAYGIGFTDVVKRPTAKASDLAPRELADGVAALLAKIERYAPRIACFHGVTGYRCVHRLLTGDDEPLVLGLQAVRVGATRVFVVPNPSGANAHFTRAEQTQWYDAVAGCLGLGAGSYPNSANVPSS